MNHGTITGLVTRTFYVIRRTHQNYFFGGLPGTSGYPFVGGIADLVPADATQFPSVSAAARSLAQTTSDGMSKASIVRVDRTVTPGKTIPGKTERRVLASSESDAAGQRFAIVSKLTLPWYVVDLAAPAGGLSRWTTQLSNARLFQSHGHVLQHAATDSVGPNSSAFEDRVSIVRVVETTTPSTTEKDTVTDVLTVLE